MLSRLRLWLLSPPRCQDLARLRATVQGRTVLVTGASHGIGEATARLLAGAGAEVLLLARSRDRLDDLAAELTRRGQRAHAYPLDLSRPTDIAPLAAHLLARHPRIDIIVSNAGKSIRRPVLQAGERQDLARSLAVNFSGPAVLIGALLPRLIDQGGGMIVNVSSVSARLPGAPRWASYQGSKAGFDLWLWSVASELRARRIRVSSVYLPLVHTRMSLATPLYARLPALTPLEAAQSVAYPLVRPAERVAPWWLTPTELAALLWPGVTHRLLSWTEPRPRR